MNITHSHWISIQLLFSTRGTIHLWVQSEIKDSWQRMLNIALWGLRTFLQFLKEEIFLLRILNLKSREFGLVDFCVRNDKGYKVNFAPTKA